MNLFDFLDLFNLIDRFEGLFRGLLYRDMGRELKISHDDGTTGNDYEAMLKKRGITIYRRTANSKEIAFRAKHSQARWAEYNLRRALAHTTHREIDTNNRKAQRYNGVLPPAWADQKEKRR